MGDQYFEKLCQLSEQDICLRYITPAIEGAGWARTQIRREMTLTAGRVIVRGRMTVRGEQKRADYVLFYRNGLPLAVIEAKDATHSVGSGMQQALGYAQMLDVPFVFSSNGQGFLFHDATAAGLGEPVEREIAMDEFPTPEDLLARWRQYKCLDPESKYPVITTTSRLMTTGVDAQTCKLVVLDRRIQSMTEFKQIIGRGTRINEDYGKLWFTIMDFKKATELFADPDFDGDPVIVFRPKPDEPVVPPDEAEDEPVTDGKSPLYPDFDPAEGAGGVSEPKGIPYGEKPQKYVVDDVTVSVVGERVQYYGPEGKLITESLNDYTRKRVTEKYASLDSFLKTWSSADKKRAVIEELERQGVFFDALSEEVGKDFGPFDLICHVAYGKPPLTRKERAENVKKRDYFAKYGEQARAVIDALLDKYAVDGIENLEDLAVLKVHPISRFGTPVEIVRLFGGKAQFMKAVQDLEETIYSA